MPDHYPSTTIPEPKVNKITAAKLLGRRSLAENVALNTQRIVSLKIRLSKSEKGMGLGKSPVEESSHEILGDINNNLDALIESIRAEKREEQDAAEEERKRREAEARGLAEADLEKKPFERLKNLAKGILKPFQNIWSMLWGFLSKILLGNILVKIVKWMGNPLNQGKIDNIFRFLNDWWPTLLASYLLFGTGFTKMVANLFRLVGWGITKLVSLIPMLKVALAKLKLGKLLSMIPGGAMLKGALLLGGGALATYGIGKMLGKDKVVENVTEADNTKREALKTSSSTKDMSAGDVEALVQGTRTKDAGGPGSINNMRDIYNDPLGLRNDPMGGVKFNQGGFVSGPEGTDRVPAKLTAGEFVMSKGAVEKYGAALLASMNAAGGGTNRSRGGRYNTGGKVTKGYSSYDDPEGDWQKDGWAEDEKRMRGYTDRRLVSPATVLEGAVHDVYNDEGKFRGRVQGAPLKGTVRERVEAIQAANAERVMFGQKPLSIAPTPTKSKEVNQPVVKTIVTPLPQSQVESERSSGPQPSLGVKMPPIDAEAYLSMEKIEVLGITL